MNNYNWFNQLHDRYPKMALSELGDNLDSYQGKTVIIEGGYTINDLHSMAGRVEGNITLEPYLPQMTYATLHTNFEDFIEIKRRRSYKSRFQINLITITNEFSSSLLKPVRDAAHFLIVPEGIAKIHYYTGPTQLYYNIDPYVNLSYFTSSWILDTYTVLDWYENKINSQEALIAPRKNFIDEMKTLLDTLKISNSKQFEKKIIDTPSIMGSLLSIYRIIDSANFRSALKTITGIHLAEDVELDNLIKRNRVELYNQLKGTIDHAKLIPLTRLLIEPEQEELSRLSRRQELHIKFLNELRSTEVFSEDAVKHLEQFFKPEFKKFLDTYNEEDSLEYHRVELFKIKLREYLEREVSKIDLENLERVIKESGNFKFDQEEF